MSTRAELEASLRDAVPFAAIVVLWIVITAVVYGAFVLVWPDVPDANPYMHLGVYLFPFVGFVGHTLRQARASRPDQGAL